jgi:hypothetical protein
MGRFILVALVSGILFGVFDGVIHANPLAQRLLVPFQPIAREKVNIVAGIAIDIFYGFVMAGLFLLLYPSLPGATPILKGLGYGLVAWFFRVLMSVLSQGVMYKLPPGTLIYLAFAGLIEMGVLGMIYGALLKP